MENQDLDSAKTEEQSKKAKTLESVGWGLFFTWIGIAFLVKIPMGLGMLGAGIITLGVQVARFNAKLKLEGFWVIVGILFLAGGFWEMFTPVIPLVPLLLIAAGAVILASTLWTKRDKKEKGTG